MMRQRSNFSDALCEASIRNSPTCIGIDPIPDLMIALKFFDGSSENALADSLTHFGYAAVDAAVDNAAVIKPQAAHFEVWGRAGHTALQRISHYASSSGVLVLFDAKRGDIASTAASYAHAYLSSASFDSIVRPEFDAVTVNPFLGKDSIGPFRSAIQDGLHGIFVCVKTSNPGSIDIQNAISRNGQSVSLAIAGWINDLTDLEPRSVIGSHGFGPIGAVVGATFPDEAKEIREALPRSIFLVPGLGAQGADPADLSAFFDERGLGAVVSSSRAITFQDCNSESVRSYSQSVQSRAARFAETVQSGLSLKT